MNVQNQTKNIMSKAIDNYANENNVENYQTQLMINSDENSDVPTYKLLIKNKIKQELTFNEILNVKIDFLGREQIATPFIANTLKRLSKEQNCDLKDVNVLIYKIKDNENINLYVFQKSKPIKAITLDYIFENNLN